MIFLSGLPLAFLFLHSTFPISNVRTLVSLSTLLSSHCSLTLIILLPRILVTPSLWSTRSLDSGVTLLF